MFEKSPAALFAAVFNVPQGFVMSLAMLLFNRQFSGAALAVSFVEAYCAGVMFTWFVRVPAFGAWAARITRADRHPVSGYLVSNLCAGALMGVLMNLTMTFMALGPVPYFFAAFVKVLPFAMVVSALSSCAWIGPTGLLVKKVFPQ